MTSQPNDVDSEPETANVAAPATTSTGHSPSPQYSPSISHDENEGLGGSGTGSEVMVQSSKSDEKVDREWEGSDDDEGKDDDWKESWSDFETEKQEEKQEEEVSNSVVRVGYHQQDLPRVTAPTGKTGSKLVLKQAKTSSDKSNSTKKKENFESMWNEEEVDLFADMAPKITTSSVSSLGSSKHDNSGKTTPIITPPAASAAVSTTTGASNSLQYQPAQEVCVCTIII